MNRTVRKDEIKMSFRKDNKTKNSEKEIYSRFVPKTKLLSKILMPLRDEFVRFNGKSDTNKVRNKFHCSSPHVTDRSFPTERREHFVVEKPKDKSIDQGFIDPVKIAGIEQRRGLCRQETIRPQTVHSQDLPPPCFDDSSDDDYEDSWSKSPKSLAEFFTQNGDKLEKLVQNLIRQENDPGNSAKLQSFLEDIIQHQNMNDSKVDEMEEYSSEQSLTDSNLVSDSTTNETLVDEPSITNETLVEEECISQDGETDNIPEYIH